MRSICSSAFTPLRMPSSQIATLMATAVPNDAAIIHCCGLVNARLRVCAKRYTDDGHPVSAIIAIT